MIALVRVDNRLVHGQIIEAWVPFLKADRILVADDQSAGSQLAKACLSMAARPGMGIEVTPIDATDFEQEAQSPSRTLVLLRDVADVERARARGLSLSRLNVGNVHFHEGRRKISPSVFLDEDEVKALCGLATQGVEVEAQAIPAEKPLHLPEIAERFKAATP